MKDRLKQLHFAPYLWLAFPFLLLAFMGCPNRNEDTCQDRYPGSNRMSGLQFQHDPTALLNPGDEIAFRFDGWCDRVPAGEEECRCKLTVDSLVFPAIAQNFVGTQVKATLRIPKRAPDYNDVIITLQLDQLVLPTNNPIIVYPGGILSIDLGDSVNVDPAGWMVELGGLAIVENIDGSDGGGVPKRN